jgi:hypothetical protein
MPTVEKTIPIVLVRDAMPSVDWYTRMLGFRLRFEEGEGEYIGLERDGAQIHLAPSSAPPSK